MKTSLQRSAMAMCLMACGSQAVAADLNGHRPAAPVPAYADTRPALWTGLYVGATLGGGAGVFDVDKFGKENEIKRSRANVGGLIGYNFTNGPFVWGVEADLQSSPLRKAKAIDPNLGPLSVDGGLLGSVRLRAGYAWDTVLVYGTAGLAFTNTEVKAGTTKIADFSTGVALGAGVEWMFADGWTARAEGLVYGFGDKDNVIAGTKRDAGFGASTVRLGITRKF